MPTHKYDYLLNRIQKCLCLPLKFCLEYINAHVNDQIAKFKVYIDFLENEI